MEEGLERREKLQELPIGGEIMKNRPPMGAIYNIKLGFLG